MNELQLTRELFAEPPPPDAEVVARARRLATGSRRRMVRPRWVVPGLGLGAVAAAAITLAAVVHPVGSAGPSPSPEPMSASQVLLAAAESSAKAPATSGTYWFTHVLQGRSIVVRGRAESYVVEIRSEHKDWTYARSPRRTDAETKAGRGGTTTHYWAERRLGARPARPSDVAAWKRAGSPSWYHVPVRGGTDGRVSAKATPWRTYQERTAFQTAFADGSLKDLRGLPTDPAGLRRHFLSRPRSSQDTRQDWQTDTQWLYAAAGHLLAAEPVPAQVRAAAYRMLAELPGVRSLGRVLDPLGRPGVAVAVNGTPATEDRLVIDPSTGRMLARESISLRGGSLPSGTFLYWEAALDATWTDKAPAHAGTPPG